MSDYINRDYQLRIQDIITKLWGYKNFTYFKNPNKDIQSTVEYGNLNALETKFKQKTSYLGTPIIMPHKMQISPKGQEVQFYDFPNEPLLEIHGSKKIIETDVDGQDGTFKELYNLGDYSVTIRGVAIDDRAESEDYPEDIIRNLRTIFELRHHLEVDNPLLALFNIKYLTIYDFDLPKIEGAPSMQPYEFMCKSDKDFNLELRKTTASF